MFGCGSQNRPPTVQELIAAIQNNLEELRSQNKLTDERLQSLEESVEVLEKQSSKNCLELQRLEGKTDYLEQKINESQTFLITSVDEKFENQDKEIEGLLQSIVDKQSLTDENVFKLKSAVQKRDTDIQSRLETTEKDFKALVNDCEENTKKDFEEQSRLIRYDLQENFVNLQNENEKLKSNLKNTEESFNLFKTEVKRVISHDIKENEKNIVNNKQKISESFTAMEEKVNSLQKLLSQYKEETERTESETSALVMKNQNEIKVLLG